MIFLYISIIYLVITSFILVFNRKNLSSLKKAKTGSFDADAPLVSICIPARNEEHRVEDCVNSALSQDYPNVEVLVIDDNSVDRTAEILRRLNHPNIDRLDLINGKEKPSQWLGKPWACHQLAERANGDILVFIDADTRLERDIITRTVRTMGHDVVDFLTIWPRQHLVTIWEKIIIPLMYYALLSILPVRYVYRSPRWLPAPLKARFGSYFAAACGQFMAFKTTVYHKIGGHASVKERIIEDVALSKLIKKMGYRMRMYHGLDTISCRMYSGKEEIREGFRKNFLAGFGYNTALFLAAAFLHIVVYLLPFLLLPIAIVSGQSNILLLSSVSVTLILLHRTLIAFWFRWNPLYGLLHPVAVLWFQLLGVTVLIDFYTGRNTTWKGRKIR